MQNVSLSQLAKRTGISRDAIIELRTGRSRPHPRNRDSLVSALRELKLI
jgi:transcriptional regulator with XRE-family HTH domain